MTELIASVSRLFYKVYGKKVLKGLKNILLLIIFLLMKILQGVSIERIIKTIEELEPKAKVTEEKSKGLQE